MPTVVWSGCDGSDGVSTNTSNKKSVLCQSLFTSALCWATSCVLQLKDALVISLITSSTWSYDHTFRACNELHLQKQPGLCGKEFQLWSFIFRSWYLLQKKKKKARMFHLERIISYLLDTPENARRAPGASRGLKITGANSSYVELFSSFARPQQHADLLIGTPGVGQALLAAWVGNTGWQSQVASTKPLRPEGYCISNRQLAKSLQCFLEKHQPQHLVDGLQNRGEFMQCLFDWSAMHCTEQWCSFSTFSPWCCNLCLSVSAW